MALVNIKKSIEGYFSFVYDGDEANAIIDNAPNATAFGSIIHFKTKNGAPIFAKQNITYLDVVYTDISNTDFTFTSIQELYIKLIDEEFFKGLNQSSGSGETRFDALEDTFTYPGNDGKVAVVNSAQNKLVPVTFYNYKDFTDLGDVAVDSLIVGKILSVALVGGVPKIVLTDANDDPVQLANVMGYFDYNDLATQTTPLTLVANVEKQLTNDTLGDFTDITQRPYGVPSIWSTSANAYDFTYLTVGDTLDIRVDIEVTTTSANQTVEVYLRLADGSVSEYDLNIAEVTFKTAGVHKIVRYTGAYLGSQNFIDFPAKLFVKTDASGTCKVNGTYNRILRKGINLINFTIDEDPNADHFKGYWDASLNDPFLQNGIGQVGDWFEVSIGGTIFGRTWSVKDSIYFNGSDWVLKVNNNQVGGGGGVDVTASHFKGYWDASLNDPFLDDGIGQIGDYYTTSVEGESLGQYFNFGDRVEYDGFVWNNVGGTRVNGLMDVLSQNQTVTSGVVGNFNRNEFSSVLSDQGFGAFDNYTGVGFYLNKDDLSSFNALGNRTKIIHNDNTLTDNEVKLPSDSGTIALKNEILRIKTIL